MYWTLQYDKKHPKSVINQRRYNKWICASLWHPALESNKWKRDNPTKQTIDDIVEVKAWTCPKNQKKHELTGNIIKDFRPEIVGENKYQLLTNGEQ